MSKGVDDFPERLRRACLYAGVAYSPTKIGHHIGENKQTVHAWMHAGSLPRADTLFMMADKFGVDPRWLATGEGPGPGAAAQYDFASVNEVTGRSKFHQDGKRKLQRIKKA